MDFYEDAPRLTKSLRYAQDGCWLEILSAK